MSDFECKRVKSHCRKKSSLSTKAAKRPCRTKSNHSGTKVAPYIRGKSPKCQALIKIQRSWKKKSQNRKLASAKKLIASHGYASIVKKKLSAKKSSSPSSSALPHFAKIASGLKLAIGSKFTTDTGTYKRVSKSMNSKGYVKM